MFHLPLVLMAALLVFRELPTGTHLGPLKRSA